MVAFAKKLAAERPEEVALRDPERTLSWAELDDALNRTANALLATDLGPQYRIAVFAENAVETAIAHMGGLIGGASTVPVNFHLTAEEVAYILEDSGTRILFVGPETVERGIEAAREAGVETVIGWRCDAAAGVTPWSDWLAGASGEDPPLDHAPRPNLLYTSGTTGRPKGTNLPPTMFAAGDTVAEHLESVAKGLFAQFGVHGVIGPLYHTGPLSGSRTLVAGVPVVILARFDAEATLKAIHDHKIASTVLVPTHFVRFLALPEETRAKYDLSSLKWVAHTGAACPVDVKKAMIDWWGPVLFEAYGASEVGTTCSITSPEWLEHPGSVGRANPPFEALVDGYVFITDRFSDMIVSGGVNIYPAEAENVLINHPGIADVACIGVPNAEMGEELKALVIPEDSANPPAEAEIIAWVRDQISTYKCPRTVEFVEDLGRNTMGKINKRKLRAPYWESN
jgi:long-chain acyl-CoA synthetase